MKRQPLSWPSIHPEPHSWTSKIFCLSLFSSVVSPFSIQLTHRDKRNFPEITVLPLLLTKPHLIASNVKIQLCHQVNKHFLLLESLYYFSFFTPYLTTAVLQISPRSLISGPPYHCPTALTLAGLPVGDKLPIHILLILLVPETSSHSSKPRWGCLLGHLTAPGALLNTSLFPDVSLIQVHLPSSLKQIANSLMERTCFSLLLGPKSHHQSWSDRFSSSDEPSEDHRQVGDSEHKADRNRQKRCKGIH